MPKLPQHLTDSSNRRFWPEKSARVSAEDSRPDGGWTSYDPAASPKQMELIRQLLMEKDYRSIGSALAQSIEAVTSGRSRFLNRKDASALINELLACPRKGQLPAPPVEEGIYRTRDGRVFKVQKNPNAGSIFTAKLLSQKANGGWRFVSKPGNLAALQSGGLVKLSLEDAKEFGKLYGTCVRCGTRLTDENSIEFGIGPICRQYFS